MIDLGTVRPGSTIRIPFSTFDKDDGSSITMTNYSTADFLLYKDGSTTERSDTAGFTATTDFDGKTGKHLAIISLADNTVAGFYAAGSEYLLAIDAVTVDVVTTGGWIARFRIGYPNALHDTTIATLATQTSFTLTTGPAEDDALNGCIVAIHDVASAVQMGFAVVLDYTGATKTVTLLAGTTFTAAATDNISFFPPANVSHVGSQIAAAAGTVTFPGTIASATNITAGTITTVTNLTNAATAGDFTATMKTSIGTAVAASAVASVTGNVGGNVTGSVGSVVGAVGSVTGAVGSVTGAVGSVTGAVGSVTGNVGGNVTGSIGSLAAQAKADVNAEVVDTLATDTYAEPGQGTPAATTTLAGKIGYLYKAWRNRSTQTASEYALYGDDAVTKDQEAAVSDDGVTLDRGEVATGA